MKNLFILVALMLPFLVIAQNKKQLDHSDYRVWRHFDSRSISNDGNYVAYSASNNEIGNSSIALLKHDGTLLFNYDRASAVTFTNNSQYIIFKITQDIFEERDMKRKKVKEDKMPKDTLAIYNIATKNLVKIPGLKSFKVPVKWDDYIVYMHEPEKDTAKAAKKAKKRDKKNGYDLVIRNLKDNREYRFNYVLDYNIPEEAGGLGLVTTGRDSTVLPGVYRFDFVGKTFKPIYRSKGKYYQLAWSKKGTDFSFIADIDTTKAQIRDYHLNLWSAGQDSSRTLLANKDLKSLNVNHEFRSYFSETGKRLFFEVKEYPVVKDTTLLKEEIVQVEVWSYKDEKLHTQQKIDKERDLKFGYLSYYDLTNKKITQLGGAQFTSVEVSDRGDGATVIAENTTPYEHLMQWEGDVDRDFYVVNLSNGSSKLIQKKVEGNIRLSPKGKYAYWYSEIDSAWFAFAFADEKVRQLTDNKVVPFYDEQNDVPESPGAYGVMSWSENDARILVYDRYDIWEIDPLNPTARKRITPNGRAQQLTYRYVRLDPEERFLKRNQDLILRGFYYGDKHEAVFSLRYGKNQPKQLISGNYSYGSFAKARDNKNMIFAQENFTTFPDLVATDVSFRSTKRITDLNPQQKDYVWGTSELVRWKASDGTELEGLLIKPENFDPSKKYPMIVNFYERSSDNLNNYPDVSPGRSTIGYSFYPSRGYLIFNPNIQYKIGYPGESAYNCVVSGVEALIKKGFVDKENVALQGHSWGGYQVAYLITRTDMFKCAEAGAPVPNMTSAYGGIRWWTGLNRMFQYEKTQSRIGSNLWERRDLYIENSPLFFFDKINTPVLIMHNDADGHVPWYQGIEMFVALKRLNKPSWLLNYNGEPHWPIKMQNRVDFQTRLAQFFDYYLKGEPMPVWMRDGVPATEVGIKQGLELVEEQ